MKSALLRQSFVAMAPSEVGVSTPSEQGTVREKIEQPRRGVATPGARINSETGDLIDSEKCGADKRAHLHQLLSSTAIDTAADNQSIDFSADSLQTSPPKLPMVNESTEI
uniref:Uncharacterized protein n=1 Tax=Ciona savignyi TaxID=51511 RepID=H2Y980_CIOSA